MSLPVCSAAVITLMAFGEGSMQDALEDIKRQGWRDQHILVVSEEDKRLDFVEREFVRRLGERSLHADAGRLRDGCEPGLRIARKHLGWYADEAGLDPALRAGLMTGADVPALRRLVAAAFAAADPARRRAAA